MNVSEGVGKLSVKIPTLMVLPFFGTLAFLLGLPIKGLAYQRRKGGGIFQESPMINFYKVNSYGLR